MVEITYQMVLSTVQTISLAIGIFYYLTIMRNNQRNQQLTLETRQAQLFMGLYQSLSSRDFIEAEFTLWKIKMKSAEDMNNLMKNKEEYIAWNTYATYYEGIGVLVREGLVDIRIVSLLISGMITQFWEQYKDMIMDCRRVLKYERFLIEVEYLYDRLMEYRRQHPEVNISNPHWFGDGIKQEQ